MKKQTEFQLRDMTMADLDAVISIEQQVHGHPWTRGMFVDALAHGNICKVYTLERELVGYAVLLIALDEVQLLDISIARAFQRHGLGTKLLGEMQAFARENEFSRMILEVRRSNLAAYALYHKAGFTDIGVRRDYYPAENNREDAIVMESKLQ